VFLALPHTHVDWNAICIRFQQVFQGEGYLHPAPPPSKRIQNLIRVIFSKSKFGISASVVKSVIVQGDNVERRLLLQRSAMTGMNNF
jgi:hypothetical protein